ncbi:1146_t:CDS:2 [Funneliformis caledonium]|uniref:1146_t:CDS:1 n=1 Tax=Funneliformis caledonium TaxID=1117310 RepID=A0A9N9D8F7_9GLOM|nr:1146_t:CDS:2 [Funneliformis caledonium]
MLEAVIKGKMRKVDLKDIILIDLKDITLDKKDDIITTKVQPGYKSYSESYRVADLSNPSRTKSSNICSRSTGNSSDEVIILSSDSSDSISSISSGSSDPLSRQKTSRYLYTSDMDKKLLTALRVTNIIFHISIHILSNWYKFKLFREKYLGLLKQYRKIVD